MKKALTAAILVITAALLPFRAAAAEHRFDGMSITVEAPDEWHCVTRATDPGDGVFSALGYNGREFITYLEENGVYLNAFREDFRAELVLVAAENGESAEVFTYSGRGREELEETASDLLEQLKDAVEGLEPISGSVYSVNGINYLVLEYSRPGEGGDIYTCQYYTVYNGLSCSVTLHSMGAPIEEEDLALQKAAADSLRFDETLEKPDSASGMDWGVVLRNTLIGAVTGAVITVVWSVLSRYRQKKKDGKKKAQRETGEETEA